VTATDLDGFTAATSVFVNVPGPMLSRLSLKSFTVGGTTTISYDDSQAAKTTFAVFRVRGHRATLIGTFSHTDRAGKNRFSWKARFGRHPHPLTVGSYRLQAIPRNSAGTGPAATARFQVRKAPRHPHHR
jgi:hypothetical protein